MGIIKKPGTSPTKRSHPGRDLAKIGGVTTVTQCQLGASASSGAAHSGAGKSDSDATRAEVCSRQQGNLGRP
jgi:hypothetical protein